MDTQHLSLDQLYAMVSRIYSEQNFVRSPSATFSHFVEVCGMLTVHDRKKAKEGIRVVDALCKALGWYFPLLSKLRINSVEDLIFRKYPYACPYCRLLPHKDSACKTVRGTTSTLDHDAVRHLYTANAAKRPKTLNEWQKMFDEIYPRGPSDTYRSTIGLFEEIGELAEAIRVFDRYPKYFAGEAADVFSYLMGVANEYATRLAQETGAVFSLEDEFISRFPGLCTKCGFEICVCPAIPSATVGRMAKELDIAAAESLFFSDATELLDRGKKVAETALALAGGYPGIAATFPFDRGDANRALVMLCFKVADAIAEQSQESAAQLRGIAVQVASKTSEPGSPQNRDDLKSVLPAIRSVWQELDKATRQSIESGAQGATAGIESILDTIRILVIPASPIDATSLRVASEVRTIQEAFRSSTIRKGKVTSLPAATADDVRRALLHDEYDILHFCGHGESDCLVLEDLDGVGTSAPLSEIRQLVKRYPAVKCVVLSACKSGAKLRKSIGPMTIAMRDEVDDDVALEFARGFYDAIAAGRTLTFAVDEGKNAVGLKGMSPPNVKVLTESA